MPRCKQVADDLQGGRRIVGAWPPHQHRYTAWYNIVNKAYAKAHYSKYDEITEEALT